MTTWGEMEWLELMGHREFWFFLFRHDEMNPTITSKLWSSIDDVSGRLKGQELYLRLPRNYWLGLRFTGYTDELYLIQGSMRQKLGWMDLAHPFPHVFRWCEFISIVDQAAAISADMKREHFFLLLLNFLGIGKSDPLRMIIKETRRQLAALDLFSTREIRSFTGWMKRSEDYIHEIEWVKSENKGWLIGGEGYSMRHASFEREFDFVAFSKFIRQYQ